MRAMTPVDAERWRQTRAHGPARYILSLGAVWLICFLAGALVVDLAQGLLWQSLAIGALTFVPLAFLFARWKWSQDEARYASFLATTSSTADNVPVGVHQDPSRATPRP